jgi:recombination protein RecA
MPLEAKTELTEKEKFAVLDRLSAKLDKDHGTTNSLIRMGSKKLTPVPCIPLGCPTFDHEMLQFGGIPRGRIIEIFGPESAGKTTTTLQIIAAEQAAGGIVSFVDAEHALDPIYAQHLGVDVGKLLINQPNSGEQALQTVDAMVDSEVVNLIVVDSAAALVPEAELAGEIGDSHVGLQARMMSQAMRILTGKCSRTKTTLIFINQIREKIGVMWGSPETTSGGRALKFFSSLRIKVRRGEAIKSGDSTTGHKLIMKAEKNKGGIPHRTTELDLLYPGDGRTAGFDKVADTITYAARSGLFEMKGSWYYFNGERIANGLENLKLTLAQDQAIIKGIQAKIKEHVKQLAEEAHATTSVISV